MRKSNLFSAVLSLFLLVPASITWAQTVTQQKGLTTATFNLPQGRVNLRLPADIRAGDMISGSVALEAEGRNPRQTEKNLEELQKISLHIQGERILLDQVNKTFQFQLPENISFNGSAELKDAGGKILQQLAISADPALMNQPIPENCAIPTHALTSAPLDIRGSFDGNASNTKCLLNGRTVPIIAESPRQCVIEFPADAKGQQKMDLQEQGKQNCSQNISGVDLEVTTGKLNLRKGESTFIDVKVTGLQNLPDKATLTIVNRSPTVVRMTNGNTQIIPIWPPADTANGTFFVHCPANSITTGDFIVTINLDLPQPGVQSTTTNEELPPGYIRKSCECAASASVSKSGNSFTATASGQCSGVYGIGINTFTRCETLSVTYEWSIASGAENAEISGSNNRASVNVRPKGSGKWTICVTVTVTCTDGSVCKAIICTDQDGKKVDGPGTEVKDPRPPTVPTEPTTERPPTTTTTRSKCQCGCAVTIAAAGVAGKNHAFTAVPAATCKGTSGSGSSRIVCAVAKIEYAWSIVAGSGFEKINGPANGAGVSIERDQLKPFSLRVDVTVTCNDGTVCSCYDIVLVPGLEDKNCNPVVRERVEPAMDGGLKLKYIGLNNTPLMPRDEFIVMQAEAGDWDQMIFRCVPSKPDCKDEPSEKVIPLVGRVRFEWKIEGEGTFVQLGCLPDDKAAEGERVIFKPPYVPLPVKAADTTVIVIVKLSIIDDGSAVIDETKEKTITIRVKRSKSTPDKYGIEISGGTGTPPAAPARREDLRSCRTVGPIWNPGNNLVPPAIQRPAVPNNDKMVSGQWLLLTAENQRDEDVAAFRCTSQNECPVGATQKNYPDKVEYKWSIVRGGGKFITGDEGRVVVYEPDPGSRADSSIVIIKVVAKNPAGERKDPDGTFEERVITVYRPGIRLSHPPKSWLPGDTNSIELRSELMYKEREWMPALAHMCRIHYFELVNVSTEKGVCLNNPVPKDADQCRDLQLKKEAMHEAFDDTKGAGKCDRKELWQQARTQRPEKEYLIRVHSRDFGAYGFLRSFGNINKKTSLEGKVIYTSIPVKRGDITHPGGRQKKTEYEDNRVTVPHDIDENRIADSGWVVLGGIHVTDPVNNNEDIDTQPVGDGFNGDGLTTYEEYRGFRVLDATTIVHQRTNYLRKDIFISNKDELNLNLYTTTSGLDVHTVNADLYVDDRTRVINPNFNPATHLVNQMGLRLTDRKRHSSLLGIAVSGTNAPAIPNQEIEIIVYTTSIEASCKKRGLENSVAEKIAAVTAHELLHGNNVCHHGEGNPALEKEADGIHGLRSGNVSCVMRYDNTGTVIRNHNPEAIGSSLCTAATGTGYNANGQLFGDAAAKRGNCAGQIRVSGQGNPPKSCGNR